MKNHKQNEHIVNLVVCNSSTVDWRTLVFYIVLMLTTVTRYKGRDVTRNNKNYNKFLHYKNHYKVLQTLLQFSISISNCRKGRVIIYFTRAYKLSVF